jgi:hypothetical protein
LTPSDATRGSARPDPAKHSRSALIEHLTELPR